MDEEKIKAVEVILEEAAQSICEELNMGDIDHEEMVIKLAIHDAMAKKILDVLKSFH